uniref:Uncharacterized protein n=1 Tax=Trieres chinensis TaxID=1514140 RepID=A0A7S2EJM6_TRICV|mmetsp:Transcript_25691/g.52614  ORF Transcript_25691/g.52614 Transcript_25691/m.52614 type:complete len:146 (+) Transcript_25691:106-543(+)
MAEREEGDDGSQLVQEVLKELPPEEKGEREEWAGHVGWHRKEEVRAPRPFLRARSVGDNPRQYAREMNETSAVSENVGNSRTVPRREGVQLGKRERIQAFRYHETVKEWEAHYVYISILVVALVIMSFSFIRQRAYFPTGSRKNR